MVHALSRHYWLNYCSPPLRLTAHQRIIHSREAVAISLAIVKFPCCIHNTLKLAQRCVAPATFDDGSRVCCANVIRSRIGGSRCLGDMYLLSFTVTSHKHRCTHCLLNFCAFPLVSPPCMHPHPHLLLLLAWNCNVVWFKQNSAFQS
jgi:hypothetical protein